MKILQVTAFFPPYYGGSAEVPCQLSRELARRGHEVTIYTSDSKISADYVGAMPPVKVGVFKTWFSPAGFYVTPGMVRTGEEIRHFDVIHLHNYRTFQNIVVHHFARKYGVPYVLQAHGSLPSMMYKVRLKQVYNRLWGYRLLEDAARVIAITGPEAGQYRELGVSEAKIEPVPNGIDLTAFENLPPRGEFRKRHGLNENQRVVLYLGRIHEIKGLDLLVKAFAGLSRTVDDIRLVIVGPDDGYLPSLEKLIDGLGINDIVRFTGAIYGPEKLGAYVDADVFVLPSVYETFPMTVLEAWACGTPVIVTDRCGLADVINDGAGLVVPRDEERLQTALLRLLTDDKMKMSLVARGKALVRERFNWEIIGGQVEEIYHRIL